MSGFKKEIRKIRWEQFGIVCHLVLLLSTALSLGLWALGHGNFEVTVILFLTCIYAKESVNK